MWLLQKLLTFFQQKISEYCVLNLLKQLTKWPLMSSLNKWRFEQLSPVLLHIHSFARISRRKRMTVETISWSISMRECCQIQWGLNQQPDHLSDGHPTRMSDWVTEASTRFRSSCSCAKFHPGLCSSFIHSVLSKDSVSGQWRRWSDCRCAGWSGPSFSANTRRHVFAWLSPNDAWRCDVPNLADKFSKAPDMGLFQPKSTFTVNPRYNFPKDIAINPLYTE